MCDGCGHGHNEFAGRVQIISCISAFTEMAIIFLEIVTSAAGQDTVRCRLREGCHIVDACYCTSDGQEHNINWRAARPEQDTIFYLRVTACREQLAATLLIVFVVTKLLVTHPVRLLFDTNCSARARASSVEA